MRKFLSSFFPLTSSLLLYFRHFEGRCEGGSVRVFTQGGPVHLVSVDGDFPPFAVLLPLIYPAAAEQCAIDEVLVQRIGTWNPIVTVLYIKYIGAVGLILPAVFLSVVEYRTSACAVALPCANNFS